MPTFDYNSSSPILSPEEPIDAAVVQPAAVPEETDIGVVDHGVVEVEDLSHRLRLTSLGPGLVAGKKGTGTLPRSQARTHALGRL